MKTNEEKESFIDNFWLRRDPDPDTKENEFREEYYARFEFANQNFASGLPDWKTDRGMIYLLNGKPDKIEKGRGNFETLQNTLFEKWNYNYLPGEKAGIEFVFYDPTESNEYRLEKEKREKILKNLRTGLITCFNCSELLIK